MLNDAGVLTPAVDQPPPAPAPNVGIEPPALTPSAPEGPKAEATTFTKDQVNEIVEKRLKKERARNERRYAEVLERALSPREQVQQPASAEAPKRENFRTDDEYALAVVDYRAEKKAAEILEKRDREVAEKKARDEQHKLTAAFNKRLEQAREKYDDFDDVITDRDLPITDAMAKAIKFDQNGPEVAYYLGTHKDDALRIAQLSPEEAALEIGKLSKTLETPPIPKNPSAAPAPIEPVGKSRTSVASDDPSDKDDMTTWVKKRNAQMRRR